MKDFITLGPTPASEDCIPCGTDPAKEMQECVRYIKMLNLRFPDLPESTYFAIKNFNHDFGIYKEVVIFFNDEIEESINWAFFIESHIPIYWDDDTVYLERS